MQAIERGRWTRYWVDEVERACPVAKCPRCGFPIPVPGKIMKSGETVVRIRCPKMACRFHDRVRLDGWADGIIRPVDFTPDGLLSMTRGTFRVVHNGIPADVQVHGVSVDEKTGNVRVWVSHESFRPEDFHFPLPSPVFETVGAE